MRKVIVVEWITLDGVVQAPGHPDEDRDGGFEHGGWHLPYFDETSREWVVQGYAEAGGFLFGRRTYENLASYWPNASEEEQVIAEPLNTKPKFVATRTLAEPLDWQNATVLTGDVIQGVLALKEEDGGDLHVIGSPGFAQTLIEHDLVDAYRLMIDPLIVGGGKRLFRDGSTVSKLRLSESAVTSTGAILATYATTPSTGLPAA
jgi:dihydrofolate reductase